MHEKRFDPGSLSFQVILGVILLVSITAAAVGLPAIWILRSQLSRQANQQAAQGVQALQSLYQAEQRDLHNLALLTAERPTLHSLLAAGRPGDLDAYLETLINGASLDLALVCGAGDGGTDPRAAGGTIPGSVSGAPIAAVGVAALANDSTAARRLCALSDPSGIDILFSPPVLLATARVVSGERVIVGLVISNEFLAEMYAQTGMHQALVIQNQALAASFDGPALTAADLAGLAPTKNLVETDLQGRPYLVSRLPLDDSGLIALAALPVDSLQSTRRQLSLIIGGMIALVGILGIAAGILIARRISRPLSRLQAAASALRMGDLDRPVQVRTRIVELAGVAAALEDARVALRHSLADLRREKAWMENLLESIVEGIITLDAHQRITFFSPGAARITGWTPGEVDRRPVDAVLTMLEPGESFAAQMPASGARQKVRVRLPGERQATLSITRANLAPTLAGRAATALVIRDVSDEEALRRLLGDFLANITHEFRTPLTALAASAELLLDGLPELSQAELAELLASLRLGILSLQTLIDNLLEGASIETGRFRVFPQPARLDEIAAEVQRMLQPLAEKYGQRLSVELNAGLPAVMADARRTVQVLVNLVSNAIKWNPPGGEIRIEARKEASDVLVQVLDQGPGVPVEHRRDLFRRFMHVDAGGGRREAGAGLGLSVVKAIVEAQGGQVGVSDRPGGGAAFWFTLPRRA